MSQQNERLYAKALIVTFNITGKKIKEYNYTTKNKILRGD